MVSKHSYQHDDETTKLPGKQVHVYESRGPCGGEEDVRVHVPEDLFRNLDMGKATCKTFDARIVCTCIWAVVNILAQISIIA